MGAGHGHDKKTSHHIDRATRRGLAATAIVCALLAALAAGLTWPSPNDDGSTFNLGVDLYPGTVQRITECSDEDVFGDSQLDCFVAQVSVDEGIDTGQLFELPPFFESNIRLDPGDRVSLARIDEPDAPFQYAFSDRDRKGSLALLTILFAVTVVVLGRLRGLSALVGLASTIVILGVYTLPALLEGQSALPIACVTAALIAFVALYTSHGFTTMTTVAVLGTVAALALTVGLGVAFIEFTKLSGFATEEAFFIQGAGNTDVRGLLLAGLVIGALGALDDMTVTQASVVFELRAANESISRREIFTAAMRVGRDHVASTVNTLFLAYAGASLPLLLLFSIGRLPVLDVANSEVVATEIVRTLVGSIGLVASVPITTWLAVRVVGPGSAVPTSGPPGQRPPIRRTPAIADRTTTSPTGAELAVPPMSAIPAEGPENGPPSTEAPRASRWVRLRQGLDDEG